MSVFEPFVSLVGSDKNCKRSSQHFIVLLRLPIERSWQFFKKSEDTCLTLCARSKLVLADFRHIPGTIRPVLPSELFGLQGMPLGDLFPGDDPDDFLAQFLTYNDVRRIVGNAFHIPCCMSAFVSALLAIGKAGVC